ncbi:MAG: T9SS type A sorting domain-containing protein [Lentimicrobiaceae bacterium]|nr:T9SS type A sorting domain-containing protein [Lentimicrobiaceae bacterium]
MIMKRLLLSIVSIFLAISVQAQTVITKDFNDYSEGNVLNGQDNWVARAHSAGGGQLKIDYLGDGLPTTPDETLGVYFNTGNTNFGEIATHKSTPDFQFDFSEGGTIEIELDVFRNWWGTLFGVGYDANGDGVVLPPMNYETTNPNPNLPSEDGGIYFVTTGKDDRPMFINGIVLPNNTVPVDFDYEFDGWTRWKIMIDLEANDGAGSVTLFADHGCVGEFQPIPEIQGINAGLTPGSGDRFDPAMWDGIFFLNSSKAAYDNLLVRHIPAGLSSQFIDFAFIPDQLTSAAPIQLDATSTSGLPVSFELLEGPATLSANVLTLTGEAGIVKVKAVQEGDGTQWQAAPPVTRTFEVVDPNAFTPEITIRRPYEATKVYMPSLNDPIMLVISAYIEHGDAIKFESVTCDVDGQTIHLTTAYPDDPSNGYWYSSWTPSQYGSFDMTATIVQSGGKTTTVTNTFEVTSDYDNISVTAMNGDLHITPSAQTVYSEYAFPSHVNAFNDITMNYEHNCIGTCDPYDRAGHCRVKNYRGEWVELYRYVTPFGVECEDILNVTDYTSVLQGLVEFEVYFQTWDGDGYNPTLTFDYTKGTPDYKYVDMNELWFGVYDFGDYANQQPVPEVDFEFPHATEKANLKIITTGHNWSSGTNNAYNTGNAAEFYEATHNIKLNDNIAYTQHLWQTCNPNPAGCQPQNGTWTYNRSGWCPGSLGMVWDFSLDQFISAGDVNLFYEFDPTYLDLCHPNHPDCVDGQTCTYCSAADNPVLRVSGKVVSYSNSIGSITDVVTLLDRKDPFEVNLLPNPANDALRLTTNYDKGKVCVHILNVQGQEVRNFVFSESTTIDISDLTPGMYFVNVIGGQVITKKLIVK